MTDDINTADALNVQIEEAKAAGNNELAQSLYQRQQGTTDAYGLEPAPPAHTADGGEPSQTADGLPASTDLTIATGADDETATITPGMDFAGNPEHVAQAVECMEVWDGDELDSLKAKWGSDMGTNLAHFEAFALAHPDVHEVLVASGFGDHPAIIEVGAILGRRYATVAGDPGQITTRKAGIKMADNMATKDIQARIDALGDVIDKARARGESVRANDAYQEQLRLGGLLPGGSDSIVGQDGRTT